MIFRWIIGLIAIYLLYRLIRKSFSGAGEKQAGTKKSGNPAIGEELVEDPVCHTYVPLSQACRMEIGGKTVYFCSRKCLEKYETK